MTTKTISYAHRNSLFHKQRQYRILHDGLAWQDDDQSVVLPYCDIQSVELQFAPSRVQGNRYLMTLNAKKLGKVQITNTTYRGIGHFEELNETYVPFVQALHQKIADKNSDVVFKQGSSWAGYIFSILVVLFLILVVISAGWFFTMFGMIWVAFIKLVILAYYLPRLWRYIKRNKPAEYDPLALPQNVLPELAGA